MALSPAEHSARYRQKHPERIRAKNRISNRRRYILRRAFIGWLKHGPCVDCRGVFPQECMDFDHVRGDKAFSVGLMGHTVSIAALQAEVMKCQVVCANCHRIRTKQRLSEVRS